MNINLRMDIVEDNALSRRDAVARSFDTLHAAHTKPARRATARLHRATLLGRKGQLHAPHSIAAIGKQRARQRIGLRAEYLSIP
jgi:hypothetical protein